MIATSAELHERYALNQVGFVAAMADALRARGGPDPAAGLAAEVGALAFKEAYATWAGSDTEQDLGELARAALDRLRATATTLG